MDMFLDVSFAGASVSIDDTDIEDFMDDANPIECQEVEVSGAGVNCMGGMIRYAKPSVIMLSVTVIPGSSSDSALRAKLIAARIAKDAQEDWSKNMSAMITLASGKEYKFTNGTIISGPFGPGANGEGKLQGRTYTFGFATVN